MINGQNSKGWVVERQVESHDEGAMQSMGSGVVYWRETNVKNHALNGNKAGIIHKIRALNQKFGSDKKTNYNNTDKIKQKPKP